MCYVLTNNFFIFINFLSSINHFRKPTWQNSLSKIKEEPENEEIIDSEYQLQNTLSSFKKNQESKNILLFKKLDDELNYIDENNYSDFNNINKLEKEETIVITKNKLEKKNNIVLNDSKNLKISNENNNFLPAINLKFKENKNQKINNNNNLKINSLTSTSDPTFSENDIKPNSVNSSILNTSSIYPTDLSFLEYLLFFYQNKIKNKNPNKSNKNIDKKISINNNIKEKNYSCDKKDKNHVQSKNTLNISESNKIEDQHENLKNINKSNPDITDEYKIEYLNFLDLISQIDSSKNTQREAECCLLC